MDAWWPSFLFNSRKFWISTFKKSKKEMRLSCVLSLEKLRGPISKVTFSTSLHLFCIWCSDIQQSVTQIGANDESGTSSTDHQSLATSPTTMWSGLPGARKNLWTSAERSMKDGISSHPSLVSRRARHGHEHRWVVLFSRKAPPQCLFVSAINVQK